MELRRIEGKVRLYEQCRTVETGMRVYDNVRFRLATGADINLTDLIVPDTIQLGTFRRVTFFLFRPSRKFAYVLFGAQGEWGARTDVGALRLHLQDPKLRPAVADPDAVIENATQLLEEEGLLQVEAA